MDGNTMCFPFDDGTIHMAGKNAGDSNQVKLSSPNSGRFSTRNRDEVSTIAPEPVESEDTNG